MSQRNVKVKNNFDELSNRALHVLRVNDKAEITKTVEEFRLLQKEQPHPVHYALLTYLEGYWKRNEIPIEEFKEIIHSCVQIFKRYQLYELATRCRVSLALEFKYTYTKYGESLEELSKAEIMAEKYLDTNSIVLSEIILVKSSVYFMMQDLEKCTEDLLKYIALPNFSTLPAAGRYISNVNLSRNFTFSGDYEKAKYHLAEAEKHFVDYNDTSNKGALYIRRSEFQQIDGEWEKAIETMKEGLEFYRNTKHKLRFAEMHYELGKLFHKKDNSFYNYQLGIEYLEKASELGEELKIIQFQSGVCAEIANAAIDKEDWKYALTSYKKAKDLEFEVHNLELKKYIKKIEALELAEKQNLAKEGKSSYEKRFTEEVMTLREENSALKKSIIQYEKNLADIQGELQKYNYKSLSNGKEIEHIQEMLSQALSKNMSMDEYLAECDKRYPALVKHVVKEYPSLTKTELKILKLIRMGLNSNAMATLFGLSIKNIENHRLRMRKKLNLKEKESLVAAIESIQGVF